MKYSKIEEKKHPISQFVKMDDKPLPGLPAGESGIEVYW